MEETFSGIILANDGIHIILEKKINTYTSIPIMRYQLEKYTMIIIEYLILMCGKIIYMR